MLHSVYLKNQDGDPHLLFQTFNSHMIEYQLANFQTIDITTNVLKLHAHVSEIITPETSPPAIYLQFKAFRYDYKIVYRKVPYL